MDARSVAQRIVAILVIAATTCAGPASANTVYVYGNDFNLPILDKPGPGSWMTEAAIEVTDHFTIDDLDVGITLTHTNVFDLQIFLLSPAGTRICLNMFDFKDEFSVYPNYTNTVFDDEAQTPIIQGDAPFTGRFRPIEPFQLSEFDGEDADGLWRLQIYDMFDWDTGTLDHFELIITTPEPTSAFLLTLAAALAARLRPRQH